jgi:hypothetical protein
MDAAVMSVRGAAGGPRRRLTLMLLSTLLMAVAQPSWAATSEPTASEYQLKAVFLFNFTQFVAWPEDAFGGPSAPFVIGVLGKDPFGAQLDNVIRGERVENHPLVVERYASAAQIQHCNILFIAGGDASLQSVPEEMKGRRILTVTDADEKDLPEVMIRLVTHDRHVHLRIDVGAAKADDLTISSKLLRPAEIVDRNTGARP